MVAVLDDGYPKMKAYGCEEPEKTADERTAEMIRELSEKVEETEKLAEQTAEQIEQTVEQVEQIQQNTEDVKKRMDEIESESSDTAETARQGFQQLVDRIEKLTELFKYGDAFVRKVGDFNPPKRTDT